MSSKLIPIVAASLWSAQVQADAPSVAVDIAPVHSLVSMVMEGVGTPALIIKPGASPHEYRLRPSEAEALQSADLVFWIGPELTPWMESAIETLAGEASVTELMAVGGTELLPTREEALFEDHADHDDHDNHGHDDHKEHGHDEHAQDGHAKHEEEDHAKDDDHGHEGHAHGPTDPHVWLSPDNARTWLTTIAEALAQTDPENAAAYRANAIKRQDLIAEMQTEVQAVLAPHRAQSYVVFHDAFQYFEDAFDFPSSGALSLSDASDPSPARLSAIRAFIDEEGVDCVLAEPQFNPGVVASVAGDQNVATGTLDPLGASLDPGVDLYPTLIRNLAKVLEGCLGSGS